MKSIDRIPYGKQHIDYNDLTMVKQSLKASLITTGSYVINFEKKLKKYLGSRYALSCNSGTSAIHLAMMAAKIKQGDNIIMPSVNFVASGNIAKILNANIFLADVDPLSGQMTGTSVEECIKKNKLKKIKLLVTMYLGGYPDNITEFYNLKKKFNFLILEDACHALGASYQFKNRFLKIGSCKHSDIAAFSLHPLKSITTGEGGVVSTNNKKFYERLKLLRSHGIVKNKDPFNHKYNVKFSGLNNRLSDINCALGITQLKKIKKFITKKKLFSKYYDNSFKNITGIELGHSQLNKNISAWHLYILIINFSYFKTTRLKFMKYLYKKNIISQVHYIPIYMHSNFKKLEKNYLINTKSYYDRCISIPLYYDMSAKQQNKVVLEIRNFLKIK
tara:strand:+ start:2640 stop:3806 length:1167 start_codon:yes stop_codon:yes gene_type:complete